MLTPYLPYPLLSGGQIRTYNLLKNLAKKHDIVLFSFIRNENENRYKEKLLKFCKRVETFKRRPAWSLLNILLAGLTPFPFLVSIYYSRRLQKAILGELQNNKYHLIHSETFYVMPNIPKTSVPVLLVEQTIEFLVYQHFVETVFLPFRLLLSLDVAKIKFWEKYYWKKAKRLAAMSQDDKQFIKVINPNLKVDVVANGVDVDFFKNIKKVKTNPPTVLFVGNFKWLPNRDATKHLIEDIWPLVKKNFKNIKLWIVGRNPPPDIKKYNSKTIVVDDSVEDIRDAYGRSDVLLAPIRNGRGTKYKILEAMATKTPIVGTTLAVEGIDVENAKEVFIANSAQKLAAKTVEILKNPKIGQRLSNAAYTLVSQKYNWQIISNKLDKLYQEVGAT